MPADRSPPLLQLQGVSKSYPGPRARPFARRRPVLHGIDLHLAHGESLGLVGESGAGKSTLARLILGLDRPDHGRVLIEGRELHAGTGRHLPAQMVFQDPYASLDPRWPVGKSIAEPLYTLRPYPDRAARTARVAEALEAVGLHAEDAARYPHEFSGGQRQRIAIARALIAAPKLIVLDEPVSALDVSVQAQVLNLLRALQTGRGLSYLFISHDLAVIRLTTQRVAILDAGRIVECGPTPEVFAKPQHATTRRLLAAALL